jgi:hypothetical protein
MSELKSVVENLVSFKAEQTAYKLVSTMAKSCKVYQQFEDIASNFSLLKKNEDAIKYYELALSVCNDTTALYNLRNSLIKLYVESNNKAKAKIYVEINKKIQSTPELQYYSNLLKEQNG